MLFVGTNFKLGVFKMTWAKYFLAQVSYNKVTFCSKTTTMKCLFLDIYG